MFIIFFLNDLTLQFPNMAKVADLCATADTGPVCWIFFETKIRKKKQHIRFHKNNLGVRMDNKPIIRIGYINIADQAGAT